MVVAVHCIAIPGRKTAVQFNALTGIGEGYFEGQTDDILFVLISY